MVLTGAYIGICPGRGGGLLKFTFSFLKDGLAAQVGAWNLLETIDFTDPGGRGGWAPIAYTPVYTCDSRVYKDISKKKPW